MRLGKWLVVMDSAVLVLLALTLAWPVRLGLGFQLIVAAVLLVAIVAHVALSGAQPDEAPAEPVEAARPRVRRIADWVVVGLAGIALVVVLVSGFLLPNSVTAGRTGNPQMWLGIHQFATAALLVLVGGHMGLNGERVRAILGRRIKLPRAVMVVVLAVVVAAGALAAGASGFLTWWAAPFSAAPGMVIGQNPGQGIGTTRPDGFPTEFPSGVPTDWPSEAVPSDWGTPGSGGRSDSDQPRPDITPGAFPNGPGGGRVTNQPLGDGAVPGLAQGAGAVARAAAEYLAIMAMVGVLVGAGAWALGRRRGPASTAPTAGTPLTGAPPSADEMVVEGFDDGEAGREDLLQPDADLPVQPGPDEGADTDGQGREAADADGPARRNVLGHRADDQ